MKLCLDIIYMSGLLNWLGVSKSPQLNKRTNNSGITAEEQQRYGSGYYDYENFKEHDGEDPDLGEVEDIGKRLRIRRIIDTNVTINGTSLYAIQHGQIILQTNCKLLTEAEFKDLSFRLPIEGLPVGSGYKLIEIGNTVYKVCMKYHTAIESFRIRMGRNPDKQTRYDELDAIFNGVFTRLIKQYDTINIERVRYLFVERVNNKNNVEVNGVTYRVDTGVNRVKEIEQQGDVFRSDSDGERITVYLGRLVPILVEGGYKQMSVDDTVPKFESEMLEEEMEEVSDLHNTFNEALHYTNPLQQQLHQYGNFFNALYSKLPPDGTHDVMALRNMTPNEYGNYLKKLFHVVINSHLTEQQKTAYKTELRSYYGDKTRRSTFTLEFVDELRSKLTAASDASLLKYTNILDTVPVIDNFYYNENDRSWIDHYISNLHAVYMERQSYLHEVNIFGTEIGISLQEINTILKDHSVEIKRKYKPINDLLQKIKNDFLTQLSALMTNVKELVDNIDPSFGIFSDVTPGVLVNSADVERSKQVLDRIRQVFLSEQLELVEELEDLNANLIADDHDDFEGGSRLKRKQKLKTTKKRNKKHRKQNKSKRHKGYLRR
jgi:hypothetical protein